MHAYYVAIHIQLYGYKEMDTILGRCYHKKTCVLLLISIIITITINTTTTKIAFLFLFFNFLFRDFFMKRTIQHGDLITFLSLLRSPRKISLSSKLIQLITTLEYFPSSNGDYSNEFRHWVPQPIDIGLRTLKETTNLDQYTAISNDVIELIAR